MQFIRQRVPSFWRSHGKGTTTIRVQLEPCGDEQVAGWLNGDAVVQRLERTACTAQTSSRAVKTLVYHPAELVHDPICHIEPVQLSMKELCQTTLLQTKDKHAPVISKLTTRRSKSSPWFTSTIRAFRATVRHAENL